MDLHSERMTSSHWKLFPTPPQRCPNGADKTAGAFAGIFIAVNSLASTC